MWCWPWPRGWGGICQVYHWKVTLVFPLSILYSLGRSYTICCSHFMSKHLHFTSLKAKHLCKLFWILLHRQFAYSPSSIYLYEYGLMDIYLKFWVISNIIYFVQIISVLNSLSSLIWLTSLWHTLIIVCAEVSGLVLVFSTVLLAGTQRGSQVILFVSCLSPTTSHFSTQP